MYRPTGVKGPLADRRETLQHNRESVYFNHSISQNFLKWTKQYKLSPMEKLVRVQSRN